MTDRTWVNLTDLESLNVRMEEGLWEKKGVLAMKKPTKKWSDQPLLWELCDEESQLA
ncbi:MAG: hypothetical protein WBN92_01005 [Terriglobia bacterium]